MSKKKLILLIIGIVLLGINFISTDLYFISVLSNFFSNASSSPIISGNSMSEQLKFDLLISSIFSLLFTIILILMVVSFFMRNNKHFLMTLVIIYVSIVVVQFVLVLFRPYSWTGDLTLLSYIQLFHMFLLPISMKLYQTKKLFGSMVVFSVFVGIELYIRLYYTIIYPVSLVNIATHLGYAVLLFILFEFYFKRFKAPALQY